MCVSSASTGLCGGCRVIGIPTATSEPIHRGTIRGAGSGRARSLVKSLAHNGTAAAAEFQRLVDHRGIVLNCVTGAPSHLQLGRAYAMAGDTAKAKAAYHDFFALWKDADPDIPILIVI